MASRRRLLVWLSWSRATVTAVLGFFVCYLLFAAAPTHGLDPDKRVTQYLRTSWRIQNGSAPSGMVSIAQTSDGFLWLVSLSGDLYRFDGVQLLPWQLPADAGSAGALLKVYGDHAGGLWVLRKRGIVHLKRGIVTSHFELEGLQAAQNISEASDGSLWIVRGSNTVSDAPLCHVTDRAVKCLSKSDGIPISPITSLLADGKGGFWLGGERALVHWRDGVSETYTIEGLKSNAGQAGILSMALSPEGSLIVGIETDGPGLGLSQFKGSSVRSFVTPAFDGSKVGVYAMTLDRDGNVWVGTNKGLLRIRGNVVDHYGRGDGLSSDTVFALFEDREGLVWAATINGLDSFRDPAVTTYSAVEGLGTDAAAGVLAAKDGTLWVANNGSLDHIANGTVSSVRAGAGLPGHQVSSLLEDSGGNLWVGVDDGLYQYKDGHFRRLPEPNHQPLGLVVGITEDTDGNIWAECVGNPRKLVRIRDFQVREELSAPQIPPGRTLAPDPGGGIWISTLNGEIALLRNGVLQTKFPLNPGGDPFNRKIVVEKDGSVVAGSENGLVGWRNGIVQRLTTKNGLPCNFILSFIQDKEKRWWLYTRCGIVEFPDSELQRWWANPEAVVQTRVYDSLDGAHPDFSSFNSSAASPDGRVWFANSAVVQMVDPSRFSQKAPPAETYIESITVDRRELAATDNLKLPPNPRNLQIDYTSPTFLISQRVKFRYRLDPYDHEWHDAGARRQAFYTDLPPRKYSFRVIAANSEGVWDDSPAKLEFSVMPAYYQTSWFRALCAMLFLGLVGAAYQWRLRQLQHRFEITLDARVGERTRIARELHDTLLQSFHGLLLRFQAVSQLLPDRPVDAKQKLDEAIKQAAGAVTEGRDAVQGLRTSTLEANDLALAVSTLGEELAADSNNHRCGFRVAVEGETRDLHPIIRDEIYKLAAEALRNAFRHACAKQVEVEIRYDNEQFRLRIRDDGTGIDSAVLSRDGTEGHYGLRGMRERAKLIGGKLTVWSEVNAGTELELYIPAPKAYMTPRRSSWFSRNFTAKA
jgi:signal transduction histidine kinase/ligand-binding sensor domain-containing protein